MALNLRGRRSDENDEDFGEDVDYGELGDQGYVDDDNPFASSDFDEVTPTAPTTVYEWPDPAKPSALLIPKAILDQRAERKTLRVAAIGLVAAVSVLIGIAVTVTVLASGANSEKEAAQSQLAAAQAQVAANSDVATYFDGLSARRDALIQQLGYDVSYQKLIGTIVNAVPVSKGVTISTVTFQSETPCPSPDPFTAEPLLGCIKLDGTAKTPAAAALFVENLRRVGEGANLVQPLLTGVSSDQQDSYGYTLTVNYTTAALSLRFTDGERPPAPVVPGQPPAGAPAGAPADPAATQPPA